MDGGGVKLVESQESRSAEDLITSKLASGRAQDIADADAIRKAAESQRPDAKKKPPGPSGPSQ